MAAIPEHSGGHWNGGGELLVSTGDIVRRWKEYFEDLLNPTDMPSVEEPEAEDSEAPGVDEIRPEYLKSLDVVGLSWLTRLCNIAWWSGTVPLGWATGVVVPLFKKGDRRVRSNYRGITLLSLPGKVYSRVLERRVRPLFEPRIQEGRCGFRPSRGTLDQLYTLHRVLKGSWEFAQSVHMCFVDSEKAFNHVPRGILWEVLWEYGVRGPLLRAVWSLYNWSKSLVRIVSCKSDLFPVHFGLRQGCPLSLVLFIVFMDRISRRSQGLEGVRFGDHRISSLIFADDVVLLAPSSLDLQHALGRFAAECEAARMRVSTTKSEAMVLDRKKVACTLQVINKGKTMELLIKGISGKKQHVNVLPNITIGKLKQDIAPYFGARASRLKLSASGQILDSEQKTVSQYSLSSGSTVMLLISMNPVPFQVFMKNEKGQIKTYDITEEETIDQLMTKIYQKERTPMDQQRLIYNGKELQCGRKLQDYDIGPESTIHMALRLRWG
ncbi:hypothetical protein QTP70_034961 [Hemibagrus guttatus]|uniref:Uncharacterized protein n=1 Tax=Hemibagrus guttatus TaxID=175788 RepID=A0AAE0UQE2_9TELE|nr:hypothetical protein QTP70_034961 [Hemibagrus guttatus]